MAADTEPAKLLLPYLQRADELQKHEPLVAYYCRLYAMERGMKFPPKERTKTTNALLVSLMNQLEKDKKSLQLGPDDYLHVEGFALNVFARADKLDRAGRADLNTAKTFYAASIFFEILNQFGELQPDVEQKQKYAAWKAADIRKALKEGRKPVAGPPGGGDNDLSLPSSTSSGEYDIGPSRSDLSIAPDPSRKDPSTTLSPDWPDPSRKEPSTTLSPDWPDPSRKDPSTTLSPDWPDPSRKDPSTTLSPDSDSSPQPYSKANLQHSTSIPRPPPNIPPSPPSNISAPHHYPTDDNFHQPPPTNTPEHSVYPHSYHHQPYQQEPQQHFSQNYPSQDVNPYSYPNFQSYPSFTESSLPAAPSHYPSYYQGSDASYSNLPTSNAAATYTNGTASVAPPPAAAATPKYEYDSNYQPPPEKIAEAHKSARFAVGALAFDDVSIAVEHLKKSLELLTNPSAGN